MLATTVILALADRIEKLVGKRGVQALERLMGLILTAIAVEMLLGGIQKFVLQLR
jgi:small neutral amino acid transporter SnatA (MarC family)